MNVVKKNIVRRFSHYEQVVAKVADFAKKHITKDLVVWIFFLSYLFIGSLVFDDYGISMDEPIQRKHGIVSFEYVNNKLGHIFPVEHVYNQDVQYYDHRDYGVIFQMGAYFIERLLGLGDSRDIFLLRHAMVFLLFWCSTVFFYRTLEYHFKDWKIALLGAAFLILSPRIFANAFYNPKDIPLLSWCIISTYTLLKFLDFKNVKYGLLHGFVCAMAINTRIVGVYIPAITIGFLMLDWLKEDSRKAKQKKYLRALTLFTLPCIAFTILFWPYLWTDPISHFLYSFKAMSHFRWYNGIFFMGNFVYPNNLPWYYIPVWIGISTPILYLLLFAMGLGFVVANVFSKKLKLYTNRYERNNLIFLCLFLLPLLSVILLKSTLYNGWRHLYFIYPPLIAISIYGFKIVSVVFANKISRWSPIPLANAIFVIGIGCYMCKMGYDTIKMHPFQQVYFNEIMASNAGKYFDLDYYGTSFKQGLEKLLVTAEDNKIKVAYANFNGMNNTYILPYDLRSRIKETEVDSADFFITNYHLNLQSKAEIMKQQFPYDQRLIDKIEVNQNDIIGIYMLNPENYLKGGVSKK